MAQIYSIWLVFSCIVLLLSSHANRRCFTEDCVHLGLQGREGPYENFSILAWNYQKEELCLLPLEMT